MRNTFLEAENKYKPISALADYIKIFEALPGLYLILLPDLTIVDASDSYLKATLTKRDEIIGKNLFLVFPDNPDDETATGELNLRASLNFVLKTKKEHIMALQRYDVLQPNGTFVKKYWQPLNRPILDSKNEIKYIIHTVQDVTAFVRVEEEQKNQEKENLRILKELSDLKYAIDQSAIVDLTDQKGIIQTVNENFCKISNYTKDELIGNSHIIINSDYHDQGFFGEMWRTISSGKVWKGQIQNRAKGGDEYWVDTTIVPFLNEIGKPYQYMAISTDISERKKNEIKLSNAQAYLSASIESYKDILIFSIDKQFRYLFFNAPFKQATSIAYQTEINNGMSMLDSITNEEDKAKAKRNCEKALKGICHTTLEVYGTINKRYFETRYAPIISSNNEIIGVTVLSSDVTEQKTAEEQLLAVNKELESFSYSVSHDLRAPLRAINGYTNILLEEYADKLDAEGQRFLNVIVDNASMMGNLIDQLLSFSRLGKQNLLKVNLDLQPIVQTIVTDLKTLHPGSNMEIKIKPLANLLCDNNMIRIVFNNLLWNAVKYSSKKEQPIIEIGSFSENNETIIYVKDNGAGFDMKYYDKLFGVFQRLHSSNEFEGNGVGLAIVNRIITKHGGKLWAESKIDEGATFFFSLPNF